jgi:hypothetical protein
MSNHRFILQPYKGMKTRFHCPRCDDKRKTFVRYIDTETNQHIADHVGKCERSDSCGYHYTPKEYFKANNISFVNIQPQFKPLVVNKLKQTSFIEPNLFKASLKEYESNNFVNFLKSVFGPIVTNKLIEGYFIGTSKKWGGATVFWQIDIDGKIRTGKIMQYSPTTGKRIKEPYSLVAWVHKELKLEDFELKQCFFGEHLLKDKNKPVAIVESEKTAMICSVYFSKFIWLACGAKTGLNENKFKVLKGRNVKLFPDLSKRNDKENAFNIWTIKAKEFSHIANIKVSELLESKANQAERMSGCDLADYLLKYDINEFKTPIKRPAIEPELIIQPTIQHEIRQPNEAIQTPTEQSKDIEDLEQYFNGIEIPIHPIQLNDYVKITNLSKFIECNLYNLKTYKGNKYFLPHLERLRTIKQYLENG